MAVQKDKGQEDEDVDFFGKQLSPGAECFIEMLDNYDKPVPENCTTSIGLCFDALKISDELNMVHGCFMKKELPDLSYVNLDWLEVHVEETIKRDMEESPAPESSSQPNAESTCKSDRMKVLLNYLQDPNAQPSVFAHDDFEPEMVFDYVEEQLQMERGSSDAGETKKT